MTMPLSLAAATVIAALAAPCAAVEQMDDLVAHAVAPFTYAPASALDDATLPIHIASVDDDNNTISLASRASISDAAIASSTLSLSQQTQPAASEPTSAAIHNAYFTQGTWRWQVTGALSSDFHDVSHALAGFGWSYFLERDLTIDFEVNGLFVAQEVGSDTVAGNLAMLLRWHYMIDDARRWSLYADAGIGLFYAASDVPRKGSAFNFTPQLGLGASFLLDDQSDMRLLTGFRWHHISNANTFEDNRGVDALMLYAGVNMPF